MRRNPRIWGQRKGHATTWLSWTPEEDSLVTAYVPNYALLSSLLPHRSRKAICARAAKLGVTKRAGRWTAAEVSKLVKLRRQGLTVTQLLEVFPHRNRGQLEDQLREQRVFIRKRPIPAGDPLVDAVRQRAFDLGFSMAEIARRSGTNMAFHGSRREGVGVRALLSAVEVLGGEVVVEWAALET